MAPLLRRIIIQLPVVVLIQAVLPLVSAGSLRLYAGWAAEKALQEVIESKCPQTLNRSVQVSKEDELRKILDEALKEIPEAQANPRAWLS